jgi:hypothetical protein
MGTIVAITTVVAFGLWIRVVGRVAVVAAFLFATNWLYLHYFGLVYPNLLSALAVVSCVGLLARLDIGGRVPSDQTRTAKEWTQWALVTTLVAVVTMLRPVDGVMLVASVVLGGLYLSGIRMVRALLVACVGGLLGIMPWLVESFERFGGPAARLAEAGDIVSGGLAFRLLEYLWVMDGPLAVLDNNGLRLSIGIWLVAFLAMIVVGLITSRSRGPIRLVAITALVTSGPYLLGVGATAPRFLFPAIACLSLCAGWGFTRFSASTPFSNAVLVCGVLLMAGLQVPLAWDFGRDDALVRAEAQEIGQALADLSTGSSVCAFASQYGYPQIALASDCRGSRLELSDVAGAPVFVLDDGHQAGLVAVVMWSEPDSESRRLLADWDRRVVHTALGNKVSIWYKRPHSFRAQSQLRSTERTSFHFER